MATVNQIVTANKTLDQVASQLKNVALFYAPKRTGNLKRALNRENKPSNMVKLTKRGEKQKISITLNVSPTGAEYGKYWNDPNVSETVRKGKTRNVPRSINFGEKALNDPSVKKEFNKFIKEFGDEYIKTLISELKKP